MKFDVVIILGSPGAGKGTQADLISKEFEFYHFETSKILEEKFKKAKKGEKIKIGKKEYDVRKEEKLWLEGKLCSPPFVTHLVLENIKKLYEQNQKLVFSGSPRTVFEAKKILPLLKRLYGKEKILVIFLKISPRESLLRNSKRRICELMRHPILYSKETKNLKYCPLNGSKLLKRKEIDEPEVIKVRLKEYKKRTLPILDYFKKEGLKIIEISGSPPPAIVFKKIVKFLKND